MAIQVYEKDGRILNEDGSETGFMWVVRDRRVVLYQGPNIFGSYGSRAAATRAIKRYQSWAGSIWRRVENSG
jgi:hypothetical protein